MDRQAPRSAPPFGSSVKPQIWTDGGSSSAFAAIDAKGLEWPLLVEAV